MPTLIAVGFLGALPFTGLTALHKAGSSSGILLAVCAALIILMNATYQDGERDDHPPLVLKWFTRLAAIALVPLVGVAAYGIGSRIGQHGLSPSRIYAVAGVVVAACYAAGYTWAAVSRGPWMRRLETTNWITAQIIVVVLLALFSPLVDPARLSVASQIHVLEAGRVRPENFDYAFLRFKSGRWGREALERLAVGKDGKAVAVAARAELNVKNAYAQPPLTVQERAAALHAVGQSLPASFLAQAWSEQDDPAESCRNENSGCLAITIKRDGADAEVVVFGAVQRQVYGLRNGRWTEVSNMIGGACPGDAAAIARGDVHLSPPISVQAIEVNGHRLVIVENDPCPNSPGANAPSGALVKPVPAPALKGPQPARSANATLSH